MRARDVKVGKTYSLGAMARARNSTKKFWNSETWVTILGASARWWKCRDERTGKICYVKVANARHLRVDPFAKINVEMNRPGGLASVAAEFMRRA